MHAINSISFNWIQVYQLKNHWWPCQSCLNASEKSSRWLVRSCVLRLFDLLAAWSCPSVAAEGDGAGSNLWVWSDWPSWLAVSWSALAGLCSLKMVEDCSSVRYGTWSLVLSFNSTNSTGSSRLPASADSSKKGSSLSVVEAAFKKLSISPASWSTGPALLGCSLTGCSDPILQPISAYICNIHAICNMCSEPIF